MIISHKHKFIYIRSQKTASTSIDVFFAYYCGDDNDVITEMLDFDEYKLPYWCKAKNYRHLSNSHVPAYMIKDFIGDDRWGEYYKLTSIRNPLDKMLSCYFWWRREPDLGPLVRPLDYSFSAWIMAYDFNDKLPIFHESYYKIDDEIICDDYIRYESLERDLERICEVLGVGYIPTCLMHYKKTEREDVDITVLAKDKIRRMFKQELIDLDYKI